MADGSPTTSAAGWNTTGEPGPLSDVVDATIAALMSGEARGLSPENPSRAPNLPSSLRPRTNMKRRFAALLLLVSLALPGCSLLFKVPVRITAKDIYKFESEFYPKTSWVYDGFNRRYHLFHRYATDSEGVVQLDWNPLGIDRKRLPGVKGFPLPEEPFGRRSEDVDIEVLADSVRVHIDGEEPVLLPHVSSGFITADRRPKRTPLKVYAEGRDVTDEVTAAYENLRGVKEQTTERPPLEAPPPPEP